MNITIEYVRDVYAIVRVGTSRQQTGQGRPCYDELYIHAFRVNTIELKYAFHVTYKIQYYMRTIYCFICAWLSASQYVLGSYLATGKRVGK